MSNLECIKMPNVNCVGRTDKPDGYECCSQTTPHGAPKLGLWVKKGQCDATKGLPRKDCRDSNNKFKLAEGFANFQVNSREGYNDDNCDCKNWQGAMWTMFIIVFMLVFIGAMWALKDAKIR